MLGGLLEKETRNKHEKKVSCKNRVCVVVGEWRESRSKSAPRRRLSSPFVLFFPSSSSSTFSSSFFFSSSPEKALWMGKKRRSGDRVKGTMSESIEKRGEKWRETLGRRRGRRKKEKKKQRGEDVLRIGGTPSLYFLLDALLPL